MGLNTFCIGSSVSINDSGNDVKDLEPIKKSNSSKVPATKLLKKITRSSNRETKDKLMNKGAKNNSNAKKNSFSIPKDRASKAEVRSDCIQPESSLELNSNTKLRQNSSDKAKNINLRNKRSKHSESQDDEVSHKLRKMNLNDDRDDHKSSISHKSSSMNSKSHNESNNSDAEMEVDKSIENNTNMETRRTRRKIKKPEFLANNYQLEDNKETKMTENARRAEDRKKSQSDDQKSISQSRKNPTVGH